MRPYHDPAPDPVLLGQAQLSRSEARPCAIKHSQLRLRNDNNKRDEAQASIMRLGQEQE